MMRVICRLPIAGLLLVFCIHGVMANMRELKVIEFPTENANLSASVPYNPENEFFNCASEIPMSELEHEGDEFAPDQVHLMIWDPTSMLVSWATGLGRVEPLDSDEIAAYDPESVGSTVKYGTTPAADEFNVTAGETGVKYDKLVYSYEYAAVDGPIDVNGTESGTKYLSPILHHVLLDNLTPGQKYYYSVGSEEYGFSQVFDFTMPENKYPFKFSVLADVGQSYNSSVTLTRSKNANPNAVIHIGDLSYADDFQPNGTCLVGNWDVPGSSFFLSYQPKWDTWGRLAEDLIAYYPHITIGGNHELESMAARDNVTNLSYNSRYPNPQDPEVINSAPNYAPLYWDQSLLPEEGKFVSNDISDNVRTNNTWYSVDVGPAHVVMMNNYVPYSNSSVMYKWFEEDMKKVNRTRTPWVIVGFHAPWYATYVNHYKENSNMQLYFEPLFLKYDVDIVTNGHVHAYDRSPPVFAYEPNTCGPIYVTVGDGGNVEGLYRQFVDEAPVPAYCANQSLWSPAAYQPTYSGDGYIDPNVPFCYQSQAPFSDYRDPSFGHGVLTLLNDTAARWQWNKNVDPEDQFNDDIIILKNPTDDCTSKVVMGTEPAANADAKPYVAPTEAPSPEEAAPSPQGEAPGSQDSSDQGQVSSSSEQLVPSPLEQAPASQDSSDQGQVSSSSEQLVPLQLLWVILPFLL